jgi:hypothetical protein
VAIERGRWRVAAEQAYKALVVTAEHVFPLIGLFDFIVLDTLFPFLVPAGQAPPSYDALLREVNRWARACQDAPHVVTAAVEAINHVNSADVLEATLTRGQFNEYVADILRLLMALNPQACLELREEVALMTTKLMPFARAALCLVSHVL